MMLAAAQPFRDRRFRLLSALGVWRVAAMAALAALCVVAGPAQAQSTPNGDGPKLDARSWLLVDATDGTRLDAKAPHRATAIASATKLMTVYIALDRLALDRKLEAPGYDALPAESVLGLQKGERMSVSDLIKASMLPSANDAAITLAKGVSGSTRRFVAEMNTTAAELGMEDTSFRNPIGLDEPGHASSAADLATLTRELRKDDRFKRIVAKSTATLKTGAGLRTIETRNNLVRDYDWIDGVKTGHTLGAGYVLVGSAKRNGVSLISVVIGAPSEAARDAESLKLLRYGQGLYRKRTVAKAGEPLATVALDGRDELLDAQLVKPIKLVARRDQTVDVAIDLPDEIEGAVTKGQKLGSLQVTLDGEPVAMARLISPRAVAAAGPLTRARSILAPLLISGGLLLAGLFMLRDRLGLPGVGQGRRSRPQIADGAEGTDLEPTEHHRFRRSHEERVAAREARMQRRRERGKGS